MRCNLHCPLPNLSLQPGAVLMKAPCALLQSAYEVCIDVVSQQQVWTLSLHWVRWLFILSWIPGFVTTFIYLASLWNQAIPFLLFCSLPCFHFVLWWLNVLSQKENHRVEHCNRSYKPVVWANLSLVSLQFSPDRKPFGQTLLWATNKTRWGSSVLNFFHPESSVLIQKECSLVLCLLGGTDCWVCTQRQPTIRMEA